MNGAGNATPGDDSAAPENPGRRIGVLGGTFDPVHNGHLRLAERVLHCLNLDSILFIPAARPPHKGDEQMAPFKNRVAMVRIAVRAFPSFLVSEMEGVRHGPSYSVDTLKELRRTLGPAAALFFIVGMDAFVELKTWKNWQRLPDYTNIAVVPRPDCPLAMIAKVIPQMGRYFFDPADSCWRASDRAGRIYPVVMDPVAISSTDIRRMIAAGDLPAGLLPGEVADYIGRNRLYGRVKGNLR
ncbi:MAG: nicotinate-nucleotide adenylyltransferase [Desulfurivibrionaceae bacterium]|nr:nicotinate-nucleotide adenylyltransferase [Desulfurivibrionaceae bacterium]